jgi:hypothetical protein
MTRVSGMTTRLDLSEPYDPSRLLSASAKAKPTERVAQATRKGAGVLVPARVTVSNSATEGEHGRGISTKSGV